jgi:hypothetical protein
VLTVNKQTSTAPTVPAPVQDFPSEIRLCLDDWVRLTARGITHIELMAGSTSIILPIHLDRNMPHSVLVMPDGTTLNAAKYTQGGLYV